MSELKPVALWFRDDLRLADQPAVHAAAATGAPVFAFYILDETSGQRALGGASRWWLHNSLAALKQDLAKRGCDLHLFRGDARELAPAIVESVDARAIFWTRRYGAHDIAFDTQIKAHLKEKGVDVHSSNGQLLLEPWQVKSKTGDPYRVFTPYWRAAREGMAVPPHLSAPKKLPAPGKLNTAPWSKKNLAATGLDNLQLLPHHPDWAGGLREKWTPGEAGAQKRLAHFIDQALKDYATGRDFADRQSTSLLSAHLRFGEISPRQIWRAMQHALESGAIDPRNGDKFLAEVGWREFSYHLLFYNPDLAIKNFNQRFDAFSWPHENKAHLLAWQRGLTGYPIVDAGMRELWQTGYMHNRVRMIAASFLIKHLMIDWRTGEKWFWDTLCDADPANNAASWQWVAGSGADASPYFRIFNPIIQGEKFDPVGNYVRKYVPELKKLDSKFIHKPWMAPAETLRAAGVTLGNSYPHSVVDHGAARERALAAFASMK